MNNGGHLTEKQLSDYFGITLEKTKKHEIGRHLLQCDFCLKRLPQPSPEQFWAALMTENDVNDQEEEKTDIPMRSGFFTGLFTPPKLLAWGAGGLAIALIFMVLILFSVEKPLNEKREVAELFNVRNTESDYIQNKNNEQIVEPIVPTLESSNRSASTDSNRSVVFANPKEPNLQKRELNLPDNGFRQKPLRKVLNDKKENISLTRGVTAKCGDENPLEMEFATGEEAIVFRWSKVPNAVKYNFYISDDEEILIDEYETAKETSYVMKKPLDQAKTYKWKVIVTLENGNTIIGDSKKITVKDFQTKQKKPKKKRNSEIRCSGKG